MKCLFVFILLSFTLSACNNNQLPKGILKSEKMQAVLWDVLQADAFTYSFLKKDSSKNTAEENTKLQQQIFALHHISKETFYKSFDYYKSHPDLMGILLDSLSEKGSRERKLKYKHR